MFASATWWLPGPSFAVAKASALATRPPSSMQKDSIPDHRCAPRARRLGRSLERGFVLPRVKLALLGVDPRTLFRTETFHGSGNCSAIKALLAGACDVAGTFATADKTGNGRRAPGPRSKARRSA